MLVMTGERLEGILTEQDVVCRVVAEQRDPNTVKVAEVMTAHPRPHAGGTRQEFCWSRC